MKKLDFNDNWYYKRLGEPGSGAKISLPHDAMCGERRSPESRGRHNIGWFEGCDYEYRKRFVASKELEGAKVVLEFEGVYHNAEVYVNGRMAACRPYGYTLFHADITACLKAGAANDIRVIARNGDQPNSRWYTGSGIYRPVWMYVGGGQHIEVNGLKIRTLEIPSPQNPWAQLELDITTALPGEVSVEILDGEGRRVLAAQGRTTAPGAEEISKRPGPAETTKTPRAPAAEKASQGRAQTLLSLRMRDPEIWSCENPYLYTCVVRCGEDEVRESFGIRTLSWTPEKGIALNGNHVILKGACIHHDNGVLGACAFPEAEERKVRILQETGYNAIRSAHNPCSRALLEACDRLGMLVMDEYVDMWYIHKNEYDYASYMEKWWEQDLKDMVDKDYNHPSVILYSTGNEVAETGQEKGIRLTGQMTEYLHSLDSTRPVTCGINIFFNFLYSMGFGVYSDDKAKKEAEKAASGRKKKTVGSEFYNTLAGHLGDKTMKLGAALPMCDAKTRDAFANMDVAGYNYGIYRYRQDLKKYPDRLILGSETFCRDAYDFYELAKREPRIVGDFVWAGMDYIGEAGIGAWEYGDYAPADGQEWGWLTAGSGRINILGFPNGEAAFTRVALEKEQGPLIAVKPVYQKGKHSPSAWKMTDALESFSYAGMEGETAVVEVYARAAAVELMINGRSVGRKKLQKTCRAVFRLPYESGELTAVSYDGQGHETGSCSLRSAGPGTRLSLLPETETLRPGGLGYIQLRYTDDKGIWKPMEKHRLKIEVENGQLMGFGNACSYNEEGYWRNTASTYYGEALAVVRAGLSGSVRVSVADENGAEEVLLPISV